MRGAGSEEERGEGPGTTSRGEALEHQSAGLKGVDECGTHES